LFIFSYIYFIMKREEYEQMCLIDWAQTKKHIYPYLIHIRNEGKRSISEGARAKRMGLRRGVSDLFLAIPSNGKHGLWIEMKSPKTITSCEGKVTREQLFFLDLMNENNYATLVAYGFDEALKGINDYLLVKKN
jgi:hypothetical protein